MKLILTFIVLLTPVYNRHLKWRSFLAYFCYCTNTNPLIKLNKKDKVSLVGSISSRLNDHISQPKNDTETHPINLNFIDNNAS